MKLIILYGPPAVGKLTVAREIARRTGFRVFHNHLTTDLARSIFPHGSEAYSSFCDKLRLDTFEAAAKAGLPGLIFTFCYCHPEDDPFIDRTACIMQQYEGELILVSLQCKMQELEGRVVDASRREYPKIHTVAELRASFDRWTLSPIAYHAGIAIDTTHLSAAATTDHILQAYQIDEITHAEPWKDRG